MPVWGASGQFTLTFFTMFTIYYIFLCALCNSMRPGSPVGIATNYGLDGPGLNPGGDEIFRQSRPALGPTQPPVK